MKEKDLDGKELQEKLGDKFQGKIIRGKMWIYNDKLYNVWSSNHEGSDGYDVYANILTFDVTATKITDNNALPSMELSAYPNPFDNNTRITYSVTKPENVNVEIVNLLGHRVKIFNTEFKQPGNYSMIWDGTGQNGSKLVQGIYFVRVLTESNSAMMELILIMLQRSRLRQRH